MRKGTKHTRSWKERDEVSLYETKWKCTRK
jgi:hypothetical protein